MAQPQIITWRVLPKQGLFLRSKAREVLYSGAFGAGKTRAVCMRAVQRAFIPGAVEGLCRKHLVSLKMTTLRTLLEPEGPLPPVLPEGSYEHHMGEQRIMIKGGGQIIYFGFGEGDVDAQTRIKSLQLSGCGIDQAEELSAAEWIMVRGRMRLRVEGLAQQLYAVCNPSSPSHHLAVRFGLSPDTPHPARNCEAIVTKSSDNTYLPPEYLEDLNTFTGLAKARYVEGRWVGSEGLVYDTWDRRVHVRDRKGLWARIIVGQDEGYTNPACMLAIGEDNDGALHIIEEWYKTRQLESAVVEQAQRWEAKYSPEAFVLDPSAAKLIAAMRAAGLPAIEADNDVFGGIQAVQKQLAGPRLTVDPSCMNTIREKETYEWMQNPGGAGVLKDKPIKANDHAMDALRYGVMYLMGGVRVSASVAGANEPDPRDAPDYSILLDDSAWTDI